MGDFEVVRSTTIAAARERVHGLIHDFHAWREWSPWEDVDPNLKRDYSGAESGVGAKYAWEGNRKAGKGRMEIVSSTPERIEVRLEFEKPFKASNQVFFELEPAGEAATEVTWRMRGRTTGFQALFSKFVSMDRLLGNDFEKGLARMKAAAESGATAGVPPAG
jgi:Polyketide cyclase / dehydrase and lipid transport